MRVFYILQEILHSVRDDSINVAWRVRERRIESRARFNPPLSFCHPRTNVIPNEAKRNEGSPTNYKRILIRAPLCGSENHYYKPLNGFSIRRFLISINIILGDPSLRSG